MSALPLHFHLDARSAVPVYRQIMDQIRYYCAAGTLTAGDQLPSIRDLARALAVNPTTVVKAYTELEHAHLIERQQGKGVFVTEGAPTLSRGERTEVLREQARRLALEARQLGASVAQVQQLVAQELRALGFEVLNEAA